jgi:hypothetical protein
MRIFGAIVGAIIGIIAGYAVAAFLSYVLMGWLGVSDFEGERAMTSAFAWGPLGSLLGLALGVSLALRLTRHTR